MEDQLISFETAKLAKEKGFWQEVGFSKYDSKGNLWHVFETCPEDRLSTCVAPTQSLLQKWLRGKHRIIVIVLPFKDHQSDVNDCYEFRPKIVGKIAFDLCNSYEEALEKGLQEALKQITQ